MKKVLLPGILGGLLVFIWSFIAHMVLPIGTMGVSNIPLQNEDAVLRELKSNIQQPGLYVMPWMEMSKKLPEEQAKAQETRYITGPTAFVVYHPTGIAPISAGQLLRQLLFQILGGLIAALVVSMTVASLGMRAFVVMLFGIFSWLTVNLPHWNWYRFPLTFTIGAGLDAVIGWLIGGLLIAWLVQRAEKKAAL
jgi:hypothetical protein